MDLKKPLTFDEQLDKLAAHGMIIRDREKAKDILKRVNYYRFTGYALQFRQDPSSSDYIAGTTFNNPVTMDMSIIDCQAGVINCIKLGAVSTFIKRDNWVEIIKSTTLPMGVLEQVDYDCTTKKLYDGNYIIMISDGVLDNLSGINKEEQMVEIINNINVKKPAGIAKKILEESLKNNNMEAFDDCTVMVLGVFDTYVNV